jgi:putative sensory transduction regulator
MPLLLLLIIVNAMPISAQRAVTRKSARSAPSKAPAPQQIEDQQAAGMVEKLLNYAGQRYTRSGAAWIVWREGQNRRFQVILTHRSGTLITQVTIPIKSFDVNKDSPTLLRLANRLDYVKVGLDTADAVFVRNEALLGSLDPKEFKNNIDKVADAADRVYLKLQPPEG